MNFALALVARALRTGSYQGESSASEDLQRNLFAGEVALRDEAAPVQSSI